MRLRGDISRRFEGRSSFVLQSASLSFDISIALVSLTVRDTVSQRGACIIKPGNRSDRHSEEGVLIGELNGAAPAILSGPGENIFFDVAVELIDIKQPSIRVCRQ